MNIKYNFVILTVLAAGASCPLALADPVNKYFTTPMSASTTLEVTHSSPVILETEVSAPVVIEKQCSSPILIEKTFSAPVLIENSASPPVVLEDRIVKQKHFFGLGIWPMFDFEVM
jgi:hypothetical protein